jgi:hypothetical protein
MDKLDASVFLKDGKNGAVELASGQLEDAEF